MQKTDEGKPMDLSSTIVINDSPILDLSPASTTSEPFNGAIIIRKDERLVPNGPRVFIDSARNTEQSPTVLITGERPVATIEPYITFIPQKTYSISRIDQEPHRSEPYDYNFMLKPRTDSFSSCQSTDEELAQIQEQASASHKRLESESVPYLTRIETAKSRHSSFSESNSSETFSQTSDVTKLQEDSIQLIDNPNVIYKASGYEHNHKVMDYEQDQSAMQTLAEIAIKQQKTEQNIMAKSVASEYLKLALRNEYNSNCDGNSSDGGMKKFVVNKEANDMIVKPEESKNCSICSKNFSKPSQLRYISFYYFQTCK